MPIVLRGATAEYLDIDARNISSAFCAPSAFASCAASTAIARDANLISLAVAFSPSSTATRLAAASVTSCTASLVPRATSCCAASLTICSVNSLPIVLVVCCSATFAAVPVPRVR